MSGTGALCAATTSKGFGCINQAKDGSFCPGHNPRNWCGAPTATGATCKRRAASDGGHCSKHRPF